MGTGTPAGFAQRLTITGPTFVLYVLLADGTFRTTAPIAANATAATIQAALSAIVNPYSGSAFPFTDNVRVARYGNVVELYFQGQYRTRGVAFAEGATVEQRRAGVELLRRRDPRAPHGLRRRRDQRQRHLGRDDDQDRRRRRPRLRLLARRLRPQPTARPTCAAT